MTMFKQAIMARIKCILVGGRLTPRHAHNCQSGKSKASEIHVAALPGCKHADTMICGLTKRENRYRVYDISYGSFLFVFCLSVLSANVRAGTLWCTCLRCCLCPCSQHPFRPSDLPARRVGSKSCRRRWLCANICGRGWSKCDHHHVTSFYHPSHIHRAFLCPSC